MVEAGYPSVSVAPWYGLLAPAGTPPEVLARLREAYATAMRAPETRARIDALGYEPIVDAPGAFAAAMRADVKMVREAAHKVGQAPVKAQ
jgi:tripartite-type tricarboxylate transporter receptor subunit TctC